MLGLVEWLFSILLKKRTPTPTIDVAWGDPVAREIRTALAAGDFRAAEARLGTAPDAQTLEHWIHACSDWDGRPEWLDQWVSRSPASPLAYLVRGEHGTHWAWQARSSRRADQVDDAAFAEFFRRLEQADADLEAAQRLDPDSALPAALAIRVRMGLQSEEEHTRATFDHAIARAPTLVGAHRAMQTALCAKWGGSHAAMFAFAREHCDRSAALQVLVPMAHIEALIDSEDVDERREYMRRKPVREELAAAFARFGEGRDRSATRSGANAFALCFALARDVSRCDRAFALTEGLVARMPWLYFGDPLAQYTKVRASVA